MSSSSEVDDSLESNMASGGHIGLNKVLKKDIKTTSKLNFLYQSYFQIDPLHTSMFSSWQADNGIESNMASGGHIGFENVKQ